MPNVERLSDLQVSVLSEAIRLFREADDPSCDYSVAIGRKPDERGFVQLLVTRHKKFDAQRPQR